MYTFSSKLKTFSFILMLLGVLGIGYGFLTAPKTIQDVETILKAEETHHEGGHEATASHHETEPASHEKIKNHEEPAKTTSNSIAVKTEIISTTQDSITETVSANHEEHASNQIEVTHDEAKTHAEHKEHLEHVLHQLQNKPWAAFYVACIFFMLISLGVLAFYGIQQVAQAGWSPVLFRVMQGITAYLPVGSVIFFILLVLCGLHFNHLFVLMDKDVVAHDTLIQAKS